MGRDKINQPQNGYKLTTMLISKPDGMDSWIYRIQSPGSHTVVGIWNPKSNPNSMWILWKGRGLKNPFGDSLLAPVKLVHYETIPFSIPHITLL